MAATNAPSRTPARRPGQGLVEFALVMPILLMLLFGVIEFGRLFAAWLSIQNGARFGVRYAITGDFNPAYCADAMAFYQSHDIDGRPAGGAVAPMILSSLQDTYALGSDPADPANDCYIPRQPARTEGALSLPTIDATTANLMSGALEDFARLLSIRDTTVSGAVAIAADPRVSGDYLQYLSHPTSYGSYNPAYRGQPYQPGYFQVTICANNMDTAGTYAYSPAPPGTASQDLSFPTPCLVPDRYDNGATYRYADSPGQPGERVRIVVTFRHPLITPLLSSIWPTIRLESEREGIIESFRKPRDVVLPQGVAGLPTFTATPTASLTPSQSSTPTATSTPSRTPTATQTGTRTNTPTASSTATATRTPCYSGGSGLRGVYLGYSGSPPDDSSTTSLAKFGSLPVLRVANEVVDYSSRSIDGRPWPSPFDTGENFIVQWSGQIQAGYSESYRFYLMVNDGGRLWVDGQLVIDQWRDQSTTEFSSASVNLSGCQKYDIVVEFYQHTGTHVARLQWESTNQLKDSVPLTALFPPTTSPPATATASRTPTPTISPTPTVTPTPTWTPNCNLSGAVTTSDQQGIAQNISGYDCPYGCLRSPYLKGAQDAKNQNLPPGQYSWQVETVGTSPMVVNTGSFFLETGQFLGPPGGVIIPLGLFTNPPPLSYYPGVFKVSLWQNSDKNCSQKSDTFKIVAAAPSPTPTNTSTITLTPSRTPTRTNTATPTPTSPSTPTRTNTPTRTPAPTFTNCPSFEIDPVNSGSCQATRAAMSPTP